MVSDKTRREAFITQNLGLVHSCAGRFRGRGLEYDDLYSAGCMGLIKAYDGFDETRGVCFSTYAVPVILGEIKKLFRDGGTVKVSRSLKERSREAVKLSEKLTKENGREPTVTELSKILGIDCFAVSELLNISLPPVSLTASDDDNERQTDVPVPSGEDAIQDKLALEEVLKALPQKDQTLIRLRYFKGFTQSATAEKLGMSQVQVSRKERAVLAIMRKKLTDDYSQSAT